MAVKSAARSVKAGRQRAKQTGVRRRQGARSPAVARLLPVPMPGDCAALLLIREGTGGPADEVVSAVTTATALSQKKARTKRGGETSSAGKGALRRASGVSDEVCHALAAVGHAARAKLLCKLLKGPATYRALQRATRLKAGPLYHHINHLRLARLILPKQRDLYELTRGGRNLILSVLALGLVIRDGRRRPVPTD